MKSICSVTLSVDGTYGAMLFRGRAPVEGGRVVIAVIGAGGETGGTVGLLAFGVGLGGEWGFRARVSTACRLRISGDGEQEVRGVASRARGFEGNLGPE